jgi:hypothetical protein
MIDGKVYQREPNKAAVTRDSVHVCGLASAVRGVLYIGRGMKTK